MCMVSNVGDYYRPNRWPPDSSPLEPYGPIPRIPTFPPVKDWPEERKQKLRELIKIAKELDAMNGEPECESAEKTDWMNDLFKQG